jgi:hypothetical protein
LNTKSKLALGNAVWAHRLSFVKVVLEQRGHTAEGKGH